MGQSYRRKETCVFLINYHLIWCPKRRRRILVGLLKERLERILRETAPELESEVLALEVMPDHLHLFLSATPQWAPNQLVGRLKGKSARLLRQELPVLLRMPSLWTRSFFCSTASNVSSETIKRYIAEQATRD
ncbi:MAG: IS200/IS605 family transposase [Isosphaeraceae bacterium]|jgi:putative transposase